MTKSGSHTTQYNYTYILTIIINNLKTKHMKKIIATAAVLIFTISNLSAQTKSEPIFKIGSVRDRTLYLEFKLQTFCRIESDDTLYRVKSADFIFHLCDSIGNETIKLESITGNNLNQISNITKLKSGDIVEVINILGINNISGTIKKIKPRVFTLY